MRYVIRLIFLVAVLCPHLSSAEPIRNEKPYFKDRVIIAKGDKQFAPFEFINDDGKADGFSVELFHALMKRLGIKYELSLDNWNKVQHQLKNKEIDLAIGMMYSEERARKVKFGIPHCMIAYNIICRKENEFITLDELAGKNIIVQNNDRAHQYLQKTGLTNKITTVEDIKKGVDMLASGKGDAVISFDVASFYFIRNGHYKNMIVHVTDIEPERYSIVVNTDNEELLYMLNSALYQMKIDGEYDKIYYKWFGVYERSKISTVFWYILGVLALFIIIFAIFIRLLRSKVNESTRDLKIKNEETLQLVGRLQEENRIRLYTEKSLIQAKEKAEESDRLKSAFLANISHEIRTPLNAIIGFSSILIETDDQRDREKFYEIITKNNDLLLQLINDILDLSKIESGILTMNYSCFSLGALCDHIATTIRSSIHNQEVQLIAEIECDGELYSDQTRVTQVITNFLTNAVKFTSQGTITLRTQLIDEMIVEVSVTDTGIGIREDLLQSVFERFVKLNTFSQGTGLGLSICKNIIEKLGGEIGVVSTPNKGSTFWFRLPLRF